MLKIAYVVPAAVWSWRGRLVVDEAFRLAFSDARRQAVALACLRSAECRRGPVRVLPG